MIPFVESASTTIGAGATVELPLGVVPPGVTLEVQRFTVTLGTQGTLIQPRLLVNGREETRVRFGGAAQGYISHPGLKLPEGIIIASGSICTCLIFNVTAGTIIVSVMLTGRLIERSAA